MIRYVSRNNLIYLYKNTSETSSVFSCLSLISLRSISSIIRGLWLICEVSIGLSFDGRNIRRTKRHRTRCHLADCGSTKCHRTRHVDKGGERFSQTFTLVGAKVSIRTSPLRGSYLRACTGRETTRRQGYRTKSVLTIYSYQYFCFTMFLH